MKIISFKKVCPAACLILFLPCLPSAQVKYSPIDYRDTFRTVKILPATSVKAQGNTGTCWSFSATSLLESSFLSRTASEIDLSEMYTVRNIYMEKARNFVLRQGKAQFSEGALGHDVIRSVSLYGAMPEEAYSGLAHKTSHDHTLMIRELRQYVDSLVQLSARPLSADWQKRFSDILDRHLGAPPSVFKYKGRKYDPHSFAKDVLRFRADDYVNITSFTHHPFYNSFHLEVPDNFSNGSYYNLPLKEVISLVKHSVEMGYTVLWDADVSNDNFRQQAGLALWPDNEANPGFDPDGSEKTWSQEQRQELFENLVTQDDHLMHITGIEKSPGGNFFFRVKNSWGLLGPYDGYIKVSEAYFAMNTISLVLPKAALDKKLRSLMGL